MKAQKLTFEMDGVSVTLSGPGEALFALVAKLQGMRRGYVVDPPIGAEPQSYQGEVPANAEEILKSAGYYAQKEKAEKRRRNPNRDLLEEELGLSLDEFAGSAEGSVSSDA